MSYFPVCVLLAVLSTTSAVGEVSRLTITGQVDALSLSFGDHSVAFGDRWTMEIEYQDSESGAFISRNGGNRTFVSGRLIIDDEVYELSENWFGITVDLGLLNEPGTAGLLVSSFASEDNPMCLLFPGLGYSETMFPLHSQSGMLGAPSLLISLTDDNGHDLIFSGGVSDWQYTVLNAFGRSVPAPSALLALGGAGVLAARRRR